MTTRTFQIKIRESIKTITVTQESDGWYVGDGFVVDPNCTFAEKYPWYADYVCEAPRYDIVGR